MSDDKKFISPADLNLIKDAKTKTAFLSLKAEKAITDAQLADVEQKNVVLSVYIKYNIDASKQKLDEKTGEILTMESVKPNE